MMMKMKMKHLLLGFIMAFVFQGVFSQNIDCNKIDSIYIKHTRLKVFTPIGITKESFEDFYKGKSNDSKVKIILKDINSICYVCKLLNNLTFDSACGFPTNISQKEAVVGKNGEVFWFTNIDDIDVRSQMILFFKGKPEIIWISNPVIDIGENRYITSIELKEYLEHYLNNKK